MVTGLVWVGVGVVLVVKVRVLKFVKSHHLSLCLLVEFKVHEQGNPCGPHLKGNTERGESNIHIIQLIITISLVQLTKGP